MSGHNWTAGRHDVRYSKQTCQNSDVLRDHSWRLTGALRWFEGTLQEEWQSHHGTIEWQAVPRVQVGDTP